MTTEAICYAEAPSNIALIKYMGKTSHADNQPSNPSLSWSLGHLLSRVELYPAAEDQWKPLLLERWLAPALSESGKKRFIQHFQFLKDTFAIPGTFEIRSANNFPSDCGVASSASSFAALTLATWELAKKISDKKEEVSELTPVDLSVLSRKGSGSSCRSLFPYWSVWQNDGARAVDFSIQALSHQLVLVEEEKKQVSSSEAHKRVVTSVHFPGRVERALQRLKQVTLALNEKNWQNCYQLVKDEFEDMHNLFETSEPAFSYRTSESRRVVEDVEKFWQKHSDGPLVTMDAGANVHLLWRLDHKRLAAKFAEICEKNKWKMIQSPDLETQL